jgi:hypothetical protein
MPSLIRCVPVGGDVTIVSISVSIDFFVSIFLSLYPLCITKL